MSQIEQSVEVDVPLRTAYNQWTQFEDFPSFMDGIKEVRQVDDIHLHWVAEIRGHIHEWDAEITEQKPDERVAWKNVGGQRNAGRRDLSPARRRAHAPDGAARFHAGGARRTPGRCSRRI